MGFFSRIFGYDDNVMHLATAYTRQMQEAVEARREAARYRELYINLRRSMTSRACANGIDDPDPKMEPLASLLVEHDRWAKMCGYEIPKR